MAAKRVGSQRGWSATRLLLLAVQATALIAAWTIWDLPGQGLLWLALAYVLLVWLAAEAITLAIYLASPSLAAFPELFAASVRTSACAMWLVPGALLLAARSPLAAALGLAAVIGSARLLASSRAPEGEAAIARRGRAAVEREPMLFRYRPEQPYFWRQAVPTMLGALALQTGVYALASGYPLLAAAAFGAVTATWTALSVARGASEPRTAAGLASSGIGILLTLLLSVTTTAVLVDLEVVRERARAQDQSAETAEISQTNRRVLRRLAHVPPPPAPPSHTEAAGFARLVDPGSVIGAKEEMPGVVLRPRPKPVRGASLFLPGSRPVRLPAARPSAIVFTGEYHIFRRSSGELPAGSRVETGTPLESLFGTTNGGPMDTVAVQSFHPPVDLTNCGKITVALTSGERGLVMASMQLVSGGRVEDAGIDIFGMRPGEETLVFEAPVTGWPLMVDTIRILFQRPGDGSGRDKNVRIAVEGFTFLSRGSQESPGATSQP